MTTAGATIEIADDVRHVLAFLPTYENKGSPVSEIASDYSDVIVAGTPAATRRQKSIKPHQAVVPGGLDRDTQQWYNW